MTEETKITNTPSITLKKAVKKDIYSWEIRVSNDDLDKALTEIERINNQMLDKFKKEKKN